MVGAGDITVNNQAVRTRMLEPGDVIDVGGATIVFDQPKEGRRGTPEEGLSPPEVEIGRAWAHVPAAGGCAGRPPALPGTPGAPYRPPA